MHTIRSFLGSCPTPSFEREHIMQENHLLYDRKSAARQLSISLSTLDRLIGSKALTARRIGRKVMLQHSELMRFSRKDTILHLT